MNKKSEKSAPKKGVGVVHPDVRGSVAKNIEATEAGRDRKRQARKIHKQSNRLGSNAEQVNLTKESMFLSQNYTALLAGDQDQVYCLHLSQEFENFSAFGTLKMEVALCGKKNLPSIKVTGSTFDPIPSSEENFLPIACLFYAVLKDVKQPLEVLHWQRKLHGALRHYLRKEILAAPFPTQRVVAEKPQVKDVLVPAVTEVTGPKASLLGIAMLGTMMELSADNEKVFSVSNKPETPSTDEDDVVDVSGHKPMTAMQFLFPKDGGVFTTSCDGNLAYFRSERIAGVRSLTLIAVEEKHPLVPCLVHHEKVHVHLQDMVMNDRPYGDVSDKKHAREMVRQHLRQVAYSLGVRAKQKAEPKQSVQEN